MGFVKRAKVFIKPFYKKVFPDFFSYLQKELRGCESVLDLGCGHDSPLQYCDVPFKVGVDLFESYIGESRKKGIHNRYVKGDVTKVDFKPKSFDAVLLIDVLEHLPKDEGCKLLKKMDNWARKKIIVLTPRGFIKNDAIDNNYLQEHRSGWSVQELEQAGFIVHGCNGWKNFKGEGAKLIYKPYKLFLLLSDLTQKITYYRPKMAFHMFAVKTLDKSCKP